MNGITFNRQEQVKGVTRIYVSSQSKIIMLKKRFSSILLIPALLGGFSILSVVGMDSAKAYSC